MRIWLPLAADTGPEPQLAHIWRTRSGKRRGDKKCVEVREIHQPELGPQTSSSFFLISSL